MHKALVFGLCLLTLEGPAAAQAQAGPAEPIAKMATPGTQAEVDRLYASLLTKGADEASKLRILAALNQAAESRHIVPSGDLGRLSGYLGCQDQGVRIAAIRLAGNWKKPETALPEFLALAGAPDTPAPVRSAVCEALRKIGGRETIETMRWLAGHTPFQEIRCQAVLTLAALDTPHCGAVAVALLESVGDPSHCLGLWRTLLKNNGAAEALADALPLSGFPPLPAEAGLLAAGEESAGAGAALLIVALCRASGFGNAQGHLTPNEIKRLAQLALAQGNPARGERVFLRPSQNCAACHVIGGIGGSDGPDLTSVAVRERLDGVLGSILRSGKSLALPTPRGLLLHWGLTGDLTCQDQLDLFCFLAQLGKPGPFDASKPNVARGWKVAAAAAAGRRPAREFLAADFAPAELAANVWHPLPFLVDGSLAAPDLWVAVGSISEDILAATKFRVNAGGLVHLSLACPEGSPIWIDGKLKFQPLRVALSPGVHSLVVEFNPANMVGPLRLSSEDASFLNN